MKKIRHVLGISGGKDSTALAIYLINKYPDLNIEYYFGDTGKELDETYDLIKNLKVYLGKEIKYLKGTDRVDKKPFDHFLEIYGNYLPSTNARWCTQKMKLEPFEKYVGDDYVISYVGIRGDEDREGYVSTKPNIQTIFPFRQNIWSSDVINKVLSNKQIKLVAEFYDELDDFENKIEIIDIVRRPLGLTFTLQQKLKMLLNYNTKAFNRVVFRFLKDTDYPLSKTDDFPLIDNDEIIKFEDVKNILIENGLGLPKYYTPIEFTVDGEKGTYHRSRSGCFFCFYQQKIEWVWLYEQHNDLFKKAMEYEKDGYTWIEGESLTELSKPERIEQIKRDFLNKQRLLIKNKTKYLESKPNSLLNTLVADSDGCTSCFI